jgi:hypothetical protein
LDKAAGPLILVAVWVIGEYCDVLVSGAESPLLPGEEPLKVVGKDVVALMEVLLRSHSADTEMREYIMTAVRNPTSFLFLQHARNTYSIK